MLLYVLQHFAGDFGGQNTLSSLKFLTEIFDGNFCRCPQFKKFSKQGQTTISEVTLSTFCEKCAGSLTREESKKKKSEAECYQCYNTKLKWYRCHEAHAPGREPH